MNVATILKQANRVPPVIVLVLIAGATYAVTGIFTPSTASTPPAPDQSKPSGSRSNPARSNTPALPVAVSGAGFATSLPATMPTTLFGPAQASPAAIVALIGGGGASGGGAPMGGGGGSSDANATRQRHSIGASLGAAAAGAGVAAAVASTRQSDRKASDAHRSEYGGAPNHAQKAAPRVSARSGDGRSASVPARPAAPTYVRPPAGPTFAYRPPPVVVRPMPFIRIGGFGGGFGGGHFGGGGRRR